MSSGNLNTLLIMMARAERGHSSGKQTCFAEKPIPRSSPRRTRRGSARNRVNRHLPAAIERRKSSGTRGGTDSHWTRAGQFHTGHLLNAVRAPVEARHPKLRNQNQRPTRHECPHRRRNVAVRFNQPICALRVQSITGNLKCEPRNKVNDLVFLPDQLERRAIPLPG